jgi:hypothetical protein
MRKLRSNPQHLVQSVENQYNTENEVAFYRRAISYA